jgi:hypothetical protein
MREEIIIGCLRRQDESMASTAGIRFALSIPRNSGAAVDLRNQLEIMSEVGVIKKMQMSTDLSTRGLPDPDSQFWSLP